MHVHLEPVGGISGDMFIGAVLDCKPKFAKEIHSILEKIGLSDSVTTSLAEHRDHTLNGSKFLVNLNTHEHHHHTAFRDIRSRLESSTLPRSVITRAVDIFTKLAIAEGRSHGCSPDDVTFHEVGALDSIADITIAAYLIDAIDADSWSVSAIPLGSGRIDSQHGTLPVPAPATAVLLEGFTVFDDGFSGERVTPTGAAILKHLDPSFGGLSEPAKLLQSGIGFGTRTFKGLSNILRLSLLQPQTNTLNTENLTVIQFEVDDQSPEDLAAGIDCLRRSDGVIDIIQGSVIGKKGRHSMQLQVLCLISDENDVMDSCFTQTTTLGVRYSHVQRRTLARVESTYNGIRVKTAKRPESITAKADIDDVTATQTSHAIRSKARSAAERAALDQAPHETL